MNLYDDFNNYATKHKGISGIQLNQWEKNQVGIHRNMTPYIIEESEMRATQMDIFSRMIKDRVLWVNGQVNERMSNIVSAQLMYLDTIGGTDISMNIDSPGGCVKSGLTMVDVMNYINSDIQTLNIGMAASMGSILLGNGTVGKRASLKHSRVMLHQVSTGASGHIEDVEISVLEGKKYNKLLLTMLGNFTNKTYEQLLKDARRDFWLTSQEALEYGIIDEVVTKKQR